MDRQAIRDQIEKIAQSASFADKKQLRKLLEVLSDNIDCQRTLKPDRIIKELWPEKNGSKGSADLAAEVYRARQALDSYYSDEGRNDPILVSLPRRAPAANGNKDKQWIMAEPRGIAENPIVHPIPPSQQPVQVPAFKSRNAKIILALIGILGVIAACITLLVLTRDNQPNAARLEGATLIVVNAQGKELWSKSFSGGFWPDYYQNGLATRIWFGDLDGHGHASVLFLYHPATNSKGSSTTLICYSYRGKERWRWTPGRSLPDLASEPAVFDSVGLGVINATHGTPARIVVSSMHFPFYPSQIALLDTHGKTISEYWHSGHLYYMTLADLDGDGRQEIIASGTDNGYHQATLIVLDPDRVSGASIETVRPELQIHGMGIAHERLRLLFTRSDLNIAQSNYNEGQEVTVENGRIRLSVLECNVNAYCRIWYEFDRKFTLRGLYASDVFRDAHEEFYRKTANNHLFTAEEEKNFEQIQCLEGCKTEFIPVDLR